MESKVIGILTSILSIFVIASLLVCWLGCHKIFKIYPEEEENN